MNLIVYSLFPIKIQEQLRQKLRLFNWEMSQVCYWNDREGQ